MGRNPLTLPGYAEARAALLKATGLGSTQTPPLKAPLDVEGHPIPEPIDPHEEGRPAFLPGGRGSEWHGVEPRRYDDTDAEGFGSGTVDVIYDTAPKGGTVIDVRVISDAAEQIKAWRAAQTIAPVAGGAPQQIVNRMRNRTSLKIQNLHTTDGVWVSHDANLTAFNGWFIASGDDLTLNSTEAVYALSNSVNMIPIALLTEFTQEA
jgi:hypothetical protein